jgi:hypothetical protein
MKGVKPMLTNDLAIALADEGYDSEDLDAVVKSLCGLGDAQSLLEEGVSATDREHAADCINERGMVAQLTFLLEGGMSPSQIRHSLATKGARL